jgi:ribonuclease R
VLEMLMLRSLKQAAYDIVNIGHFGLASDNYLHFTSPIRRYPDVLVHRAVKRLLRGEKADTSTQAVETLRVAATTTSTRERAAIDVEREVVDLYRALYARALIGNEYEGTIVAVVGSGMYVSLDDPFLDVLVRYESLGPDRYELTDHEIGVVGARSGERLTIGDRILVIIEDVAVLRRAVYAKRVPPARAFAGAEDRPRRNGRNKERAEKRNVGERPQERRRTTRSAPQKKAAGPKKRTARAPSTRGRRRR